MHAIRSGNHLQGHDEELALDLALRITRTRWVLVFVPSAAVLQTALVVTQGLDRAGVVELVCAISAACFVPFGWRDFRRARRYLDSAP